MNYAFAGTPDFAAWVLKDLTALDCAPALVVSQPDRPRGRGCKVGAPPAVVQAGRLGIEVLQTQDINAPEVADRLRKARLSILLVASFGQLLRKPLLDEFVCLNVHTSLLPAYRGAAPIERALAAGEERTGVTLMRVTERLDEGPYALQTALTVSLFDDAASVGRALSLLGAIAASQVLVGLAEGTVTWTEQAGPSSYAHKLTARDCSLDVSRGAKTVHDQVRSLSPEIGARGVCGDVAFKVWRSWPYGEPGLSPVPDPARSVASVPGAVAAAQERLFVGCKQGAVEVLLLQPAGRGRMTAAAFLRGYAGRLGKAFRPASAQTDMSVECEDR